MALIGVVKIIPLSVPFRIHMDLHYGRPLQNQISREDVDLDPNPGGKISKNEDRALRAKTGIF